MNLSGGVIVHVFSAELRPLRLLHFVFQHTPAVGQRRGLLSPKHKHEGRPEHDHDGVWNAVVVI